MADGSGHLAGRQERFLCDVELERRKAHCGVDMIWKCCVFQTLVI